MRHTVCAHFRRRIPTRSGAKQSAFFTIQGLCCRKQGKPAADQGVYSSNLFAARQARTPCARKSETHGIFRERHSKQPYPLEQRRVALCQDCRFLPKRTCAVCTRWDVGQSGYEWCNAVSLYPRPGTENHFASHRKGHTDHRARKRKYIVCARERATRRKGRWPVGTQIRIACAHNLLHLCWSRSRSAESHDWRSQQHFGPDRRRTQTRYNRTRVELERNRVVVGARTDHAIIRNNRRQTLSWFLQIRHRQRRMPQCQHLYPGSSKCPAPRNGERLSKSLRNELRV